MFQIFQKYNFWQCVEKGCILICFQRNIYQNPGTASIVDVPIWHLNVFWSFLDYPISMSPGTPLIMFFGIDTVEGVCGKGFLKLDKLLVLLSISIVFFFLIFLFR